MEGTDATHQFVVSRGVGILAVGGVHLASVRRKSLLFLEEKVIFLDAG